MLSAAILHRRARRLLPAGLETVAVLAPADPGCWDASPLSRLLWGGARRGLLGLRLEAGFAAGLRERGLDGLRTMPGGPYQPWQPLPRLAAGFWTRTPGGARTVLLDGSAATAWLLWQDPPGPAAAVPRDPARQGPRVR